MDILKSPKYHELQNLNFFYFESTEDLIRTSEAMAAANAARQQEQQARLNRLSVTNPGHQFGGAAGLLGVPSRRHKTILLSRNLGTMRKAKEEKRKEAQADPNDDMILRILRMRPEAERYLKDRSRQKVKIIRLQMSTSRANNTVGTSCGSTSRGDDRATKPQRGRWAYDGNPANSDALSIGMLSGFEFKWKISTFFISLR